MTTNTAIEFLTALMELHKDHPHLVTKGDVEALQTGIKAIKDLENMKRKTDTCFNCPHCCEMRFNSKGEVVISCCLGGTCNGT